MSSTKGNQYPLWYVSNEYEVFAVDSSQQTHSKSNNNFAMDIAIAEDGTVWVLSVNSDPDGGGSKIYWSDGDGNWNEIDTPEPGGTGIYGYTGSSCIYLDWDGKLRSLKTNGDTTVLYDNSNIPLLEVAYGGGLFWGVLSEKSGDIPVLKYSSDGKTWKAFAGNVHIYNISVSNQGDCYGADTQFNPVYYSSDGSSTGSAGGGINGETIAISFANWIYALLTDVNENGNLIAEWVDEQGGIFQKTALRAVKIASTFFTRS